jgi:hypothetical protein
MKSVNTDVVNAYTHLSNARIERNNILYKSGAGLIDVACDAKKYDKSVFGVGSP